MTLVSANTEPERSSEVASEPGPDAQVAHSPRSMRRAAMLASIWTVGGYGATQVIRLANSIVLSYFLAPDAFGIMALINIFLQGLIMSSDIGVGPSIIQHDAGEDPRFLDTAWSIQVIRGAVVCLLSLVFAWPMAAFYDQRQLLVLIPAAAIIPLLDGMASTAIFTVQRTLNVHKLTLLELISQIAGMVVMCVWAIMHPTVWALVGGTAVATLVKVAGSHVFLTPHRNRFAWDKSSVHDIVTFGKWIMVGTMIAFAALQVDRIVLG
ncbi:MAG: oligosaccharide flippase family protein [Planctomycetales bacterium]|nr:oligosaccharide flippase family protein [Planctomycetales bacterium]